MDAPLPKHKVARIYNHLAWTYDFWSSWGDYIIRDMSLKMAGVCNGESVLEIGTGTGLLLRHLVNINPCGDVVGVDISSQMLRKASKKVRAGHHLLCSDARYLPFKNASFDLIVSNYMLDIIPYDDIAPILLEFKRVIKPGGRIVTATLANTDTILNRVWEWVANRFPAFIGGSRGMDIRPYYENTGLRIEEELFFPQSSWGIITQFIKAVSP